MQDNTAKWGVRKLTKFKENSGIPVGFEYFSTNPNIPAGSIPLFGGEYSREVYSDLWSWVQEQAGYLIEESEWQEKSAANGGNVPFYSKGNGTTTFRVPSLKCWVKGANGIEEVGSYLSAGLPNIDTNVYTGQDGQGFLNGSADSTTVGSTRSYPRQTKLFRASDYNTIYGASDTVQPPSIVGLWLVKAYGTVTNVGSTDVANIAQGLTELETRVTPIEKGGTGATTANDACNNLGLSWDYWHRYGMNFVPNDTSNHGWNNLGVFSSYYTETNKIKNQPTRYGQLLNIPADRGEESTQIWIEQASGRIYFRGGNGSAVLDDTPFKKVATTEDGGIVAASLNTNGYVKFANGLILQWGYRDAINGYGYSWVTFPIAFASSCFGVINGYEGSGEHWTRNYHSASTTGCQLGYDKQACRYIAWGV